MHEPQGDGVMVVVGLVFVLTMATFLLPSNGNEEWEVFLEQNECEVVLRDWSSDTGEIYLCKDGMIYKK